MRLQFLNAPLSPHIGKLFKHDINLDQRSMFLCRMAECHRTLFGLNFEFSSIQTHVFWRKLWHNIAIFQKSMETIALWLIGKVTIFWMHCKNSERDRMIFTIVFQLLKILLNEIRNWFRPNELINSALCCDWSFVNSAIQIAVGIAASTNNLENSNCWSPPSSSVTPSPIAYIHWWMSQTDTLSKPFNVNVNLLLVVMNPIISRQIVSVNSTTGQTLSLAK